MGRIDARVDDRDPDRRQRQGERARVPEVEGPVAVRCHCLRPAGRSGQMRPGVCRAARRRQRRAGRPAAAASPAPRRARESARGSRLSVEQPASVEDRRPSAHRPRSARHPQRAQQRRRDDHERETLHRSSICPERPSAIPAQGPPHSVQPGLGRRNRVLAGRPGRRLCRRRPAAPASTCSSTVVPGASGFTAPDTVEVASARAVTSGATGTFSTALESLPAEIRKLAGARSSP